MSRRGMVRVAAAVVCSLVLAGCGDSAGPDEFDPAQLQADLAFFDLGPTADEEALQKTLNEVDDGSSELASRGSTSRPEVFFSRGGSGVSLTRTPLPDSVLGKTWEYDTVEEEFVLSERAGAPSDGTRYIVYEVDGFAFVEPLVEIGYVDIRDLEQGSRREASLTAVVNDVTLRDYTAYATGDETAGELGVDGFIQLSGVRMNIEGSGTISPTAIAFQTHFEVPSRNLQMDFTLSGTVACCSFDVDMHFDGAAGQLDVTGSSDEAGSSYEFALNGEAFARHDMPSGEEVDVWTGLGGHNVTAAHEDLFTNVEDMGALAALGVAELASPVIPVLLPVPELF